MFNAQVVMMPSNHSTKGNTERSSSTVCGGFLLRLSESRSPSTSDILTAGNNMISFTRVHNDYHQEPFGAL